MQRDRIDGVCLGACSATSKGPSTAVILARRIEAQMCGWRFEPQPPPPAAEDTRWSCLPWLDATLKHAWQAVTELAELATTSLLDCLLHDTTARRHFPQQ